MICWEDFWLLQQRSLDGSYPVPYLNFRSYAVCVCALDFSATGAVWGNLSHILFKNRMVMGNKEY